MTPKAKTKDSTYTIKELLEKGSQKASQTRRDPADDQQDLLLALRLSKEEHVNEQRRLLEHFSKMSETSKISSTTSKKKKRLVQHVQDDDDDDWFQTISSRPQPTHQKKKIPESKPLVKTEKDSNEILLDIDDISEWLKAKQEPEVDDSIVIDDLSAFLDEHEDEKMIPCQQMRKQEEHVAMCNSLLVESDSDTDCSVIDLVNNPNAVQGQTDVIEGEVEQEDGYLSPLEGFTNIKENQAYQHYFTQLQQAPPVKRKRRTSTKTTTKKKRWYGKRKKK